MTRIICFSTLFPNAEQPNHGIFVENRLRHILAEGQLKATTIAPVPYFPFRSKAWGRYASYAAVPSVELRHGVDVHHPRFLVIPRIGTRFTPRTLAASAASRIRHLMSRGLEFDLIDAHYFYPDGVAAHLLSQKFGKPFVVTARGSDLTQHTADPHERQQIISAANAATALITVSASLKEELVNLGIGRSRIAVLRNGVETNLFKPLSANENAAQAGAGRFRMVSVGALIPRKAHEIAIRAMSLLPDCELAIAGVGPMQGELALLISKLGLSERVTLLGEIAHRDLPIHYGKADLMVLVSSREGWANVILEALACGTPVVASNVGGASEIIRSEAAGRVLDTRTPEALAEAITALRASRPDRARTRKYAEAFGWKPVARANSRLLVAAATARTPMHDIAAEFSVLGADAES